MIRCVAAFLLIAGKSSKYLDRLVVTTDEVDRSSYGVYEINSRHHFQQSEYIDQFMLRHKNIKKQGTYFMPYCSDYLDSAEIVSLITEGLTDITHHAHIPYTHDPEEKSCLRYLLAMTNPDLEYNKIDISKCSIKVREVCTGHTILNLAFKGIIAVDGQYKAFAPQMAEQPIVVTHDQPVEIKSLFLNGEKFVGIKSGRGMNSLVWYQGHLHLFKQNLTTSEWSPVTLIGSEMMSGSLITKHILGVYSSSKADWDVFYQKMEHSVKSHSPWSLGRKSYCNGYSSEVNHLNTTHEIHDEKFICRYPFFDLKYGRYVAGLNKYSRYHLDEELDILHELLQWVDKIPHKKLYSRRATGTTSSSKEKITTKSLTDWLYW